MIIYLSDDLLSFIDMPKKRQADIERIKQLIRDVLTNVEIHEKTDASEGYIGKLRREIDMSSVGAPAPNIQLSKGSMKNLILMQTAMGLDSIDDAVERIYKDFLLINSKKVRFDPNNEKSIGEVFQSLIKELDEKMDPKDLLKSVGENEFKRNVVLAFLGVDEVTFFLYNIHVAIDNRGSIIDFMNDAVKLRYIEVGWGFGRYYNQELNDYHALITSPNGKEFRLPIQ
jgi:hypothetical protein